MNKLIAIVGMCGSGKSIVSDFFEQNGYQKIYFGGVTIDELKKANLPITAENEKMIREKLRTDYGMGAFAILLKPLIKEALLKNNVVLDGLYSWDELKILKEEFPFLQTLAIVTDKKLRYERLSQRKIRPLNCEDAKKRDISEIENIAKSGPIAYADYFIINNDSMASLSQKLTELFQNIN